MEIRKKNTRYYIFSAIGIFIMLFFGRLPVMGSMSVLGMQILGIYIGAIFLWGTTDLIWPSLLAIVLIGLSGYTSIGELLSSGWGNSTLIFIWLTFVFAAIIDASGVSGYIAYKVCSLKISNKRPWVITFLFFFAAYAVAVMTSVTGGIVICWSIFSQYAKSIGCKKGEAWPAYTMTGMTLAGMAGSCAFTFRSPGNIFVGYAQELGYEVNFLSWFVVVFAFTWLLMALYLIFGKFVLKIDASKCEHDYTFEEAQKLTVYQKQLLGCLALLVVLFLMQSMIPVSTTVGAFLGKLGTSGIVLCLLIPMALIRRKETGKAFGDIILGTRNGVQWPVFYLLVLNLPMAGIINDADLGIAASAKQLLGPAFSGNSGALLFMLLTIILGLVLTIFIGNVPATTICWSITSVYAAAVGIHLAMLAAIATVIGTTCVLLPCSNPVAAMLHGQSDWVESGAVIKYAGIGVVLTGISAFAVYLLFGSWIF